MSNSNVELLLSECQNNNQGINTRASHHIWNRYTVLKLKNSTMWPIDVTVFHSILKTVMITAPHSRYISTVSCAGKVKSPPSVQRSAFLPFQQVNLCILIAKRAPCCSLFHLWAKIKSKNPFPIFHSFQNPVWFGKTPNFKAGNGSRRAGSLLLFLRVLIIFVSWTYDQCFTGIWLDSKYLPFCK